MPSTEMQPSLPRTRADIARENGAKSRGPVTPEGRARSSQNAVQHSLAATTFVCRNAEEQQRFDHMSHSYTSLWKPVNIVEEHLVEEMVAAKYQERKCQHVEATILNLQMESLNLEELQQKYDTLDDIHRQALAFMQLADGSKVLSLLLRYQSEHNRRYHRAMRQLIALRSKCVFGQETGKRNEPRMTSNPNTTKHQAPAEQPSQEPKQPEAPRPVLKIDDRPKVLSQTAA